MRLAADIGGTKSHLALYDGERCVREEKFASRQHASLKDVVALFLKGEKVEKGCFGVAGPVIDGKCRTTNLPWEIDVKELGIPNAILLNDIEAHAWGIRSLKSEEIVVINEGKKVAGNQAFIAAGTGLGEAGLFWDGATHHPFATEGGHTDFCPRDELEMELLRYLTKRDEHISQERVISGTGLYSLYRFLVEMRLEDDSEEGFQQIVTSDDAARTISERALSEESPICHRALEWFVSLYGGEAGNVALKFLALGGVYIGGGIAPKIVEILKEGPFMKAFVAKGRFSQLLESIPVKVVMNDRTALLGAAEYGRIKL
jgi:glucokinase